MIVSDERSVQELSGAAQLVGVERVSIRIGHCVYCQ